jgi:hypothetical protein
MLEDLTFVILVRIESPDRQENVFVTLSYLCKHLKSNIIILEEGENPRMPSILDTIAVNDMRINYHFLPSSETLFHRTKFLNMMLRMVTTSVVVNYDIDVLLLPHVYKKCYDLIKSGQDLVYPYFFGWSWLNILPLDREKLLSTLQLELLEFEYCGQGQYGFCQFFNTKSYIEGGMENEKFVSYAPEDRERGYRFQKLGYKVMWSDDYVYHLEHGRGINSDQRNPMFKHNEELFEYIKTLSVEELREYYAL